MHLPCIFCLQLNHLCAQCFDSATPKFLHVEQTANPAAARWEVCRILTSFKMSAVSQLGVILIYLARQADVISKTSKSRSSW